MKSFLLVVLLQIAFYSFSQTVLPVKKTSFDNDWKFHLGNASDPAKDFNYGFSTVFSKTGNADGTPAAQNFNDSLWQTINLPHDWVVSLPFRNDEYTDMSHGYKPVGGYYPQNSIGWYRKTFMLSSKDSGQRFVIDFDGIFRNSKVWVNEVYCGTHESGYTGSSYDITDFLSFNKSNVITVRVDATQFEGWFYEGAGIYRHTWLTQYNNLHLAHNGGVFVHSNVQGNQATIMVETELENNNPQPQTATVQSFLTTRDGKAIASSEAASATVLVNGINKATQTIAFSNPHLWNTDDPYLYRVITVVKQNGKTVDSVCTKTGIRTIVANINGLFVNGVYTKIKGTCNHQDAAGVGSALPDYLQYYRIALLKEMGSNAYRTSHNPPTPEVLEACDSLGMLVLDEIRLLNSSDYGTKEFESLVLRDRNHPSIFMWSIGNEETYVHANATGRRIAQTLVQKQRELDSTRTSTYAANEGNYFPGVNEVIPERGFNYFSDEVEAYHREHPQQPIIGTELGSTVTTRGIYEKDTVRAYVPDEDVTAPSWASTAEHWWRIFDAQPYNMGAFVWTGFDSLGEPTPYAWPNIHSHFGILDVCGFPKNIYYYYQSWWSNKNVLHISPHWNWKGKEGQPIDVWVNSNADIVELFLNGKSLGKKAMPHDGHLQWSVPYKAGTLAAIAFKKGNKLTATMQTTGDAAKVIITPSKTLLTADGKDAVVLNVTAVDKQGREVPDASNLVHFTLSGDAKMIGVGNGDPSCHEADKCEDGNWQRSLFNGKCQVIVQAGTTKGNIAFTATGKGLREAVANLTLK